MADGVIPPPDQLITVIPADVALVLLARAGLDEYRRARRGDNPRVDAVLVEMTAAAIRWRELITGIGQPAAPDEETGPSSRYLTTRQAAERLNVSDRTIRHRIASGHLPARKAGHVYLIHPDDLRRTA